MYKVFIAQILIFSFFVLNTYAQTTKSGVVLNIYGEVIKKSDKISLGVYDVSEDKKSKNKANDSRIIAKKADRKISGMKFKKLSNITWNDKYELLFSLGKTKSKPMKGVNLYDINNVYPGKSSLKSTLVTGVQIGQNAQNIMPVAGTLLFSYLETNPISADLYRRYEKAYYGETAARFTGFWGGIAGAVGLYYAGRNSPNEVYYSVGASVVSSLAVASVFVIHKQYNKKRQKLLFKAIDAYNKTRDTLDTSNTPYTLLSDLLYLNATTTVRKITTKEAKTGRITDERVEFSNTIKTFSVGDSDEMKAVKMANLKSYLSKTPASNVYLKKAKLNRTLKFSGIGVALGGVAATIAASGEYETHIRISGIGLALAGVSMILYTPVKPTLMKGVIAYNQAQVIQSVGYMPTKIQWTEKFKPNYVGLGVDRTNIVTTTSYPVFRLGWFL
jgi:hypothetical protein